MRKNNPRIRNNTYQKRPKSSWEKMTRHHLLCSSRWGSNDSDNIKMLKSRIHRNWHQIFVNDVVSEQIRRILQMNESALQWDFCADIERILDLYDEDVYHPHIRKKKY